MMDIAVIPPEGLRNVWTKVKEGLVQMPSEDWIPEDVYHAIRSGESALYMGVDENGYAGFMVLRRVTAEFSRLPYLHIWLAFNQGGKDIVEAAEELIRETARRAGATKITFGSPRKGWSKRYPIASINYEVPL